VQRARGATASLHIGSVCESCSVNDPIKRQFPSGFSKNHLRFSGVRAIQSKTKASTCGRTGSITLRERHRKSVQFRRARWGSQDSSTSIRRERTEPMLEWDLVRIRIGRQAPSNHSLPEARPAVRPTEVHPRAAGGGTPRLANSDWKRTLLIVSNSRAVLGIC